jgi:hypothetical protein
MDNRLNIAFDDMLHCESYYGMCDYPFLDEDDQDLPSGIVNCDIQAIPAFFRRIKEYPDRKYTIVSSRSDFGVAYQSSFPAWKDMVRWISLMIKPEFGYKDIRAEARVHRETCKIEDKYSIRCWSLTSHTFDEIPQNVIKWYSTNCHIIDDKRLIGILFGLNVTDGKKDGIEKIAQFKTTKNRDKLVYLNCSLNTFERVQLYAFYRYYDFVTSKYNINPSEFLEDLATHKYTLCPAGNGVDCYRIWEALYMGSIPIVEINEVTNHLLNLGLPIVGLHTLLALNPSELEFLYHKIQDKWYNYRWEVLTSSYWRNLVHES